MFDAILWYVWVQLFALAGWAVTRNWLRNLPSAGYGVSKALGVLLAGYVYWASITLGLARNGPGAALMALVAVALLGLWLNYRKPLGSPEPVGFTLAVGGSGRSLRGTLALTLTPAQRATEIIFALAFGACALYRAYNPNIESAGGEKYMDFMMFNAIFRSDVFPPNDAWLSGYSISYYYFGYVQQSMIAKLAGVANGVAFNLSGATTFALTCAAAFGVGYDLWASHLQSEAADEPQTTPETENRSSDSPPEKSASASPILAGLLTATMLACMGNLGSLIESGRCTGILNKPVLQWLDIRAKATDPVECSGLLPTRFFWWWDWSRVVHDRTPTGGDQEAIAEFPAFSFVLGDNHPHVMNLPFVILAVAIALSKFKRNRHDDDEPEIAPPKLINPNREIELNGLLFKSLVRFVWAALHPLDELLITAVIVGGLSFMNTWDFPIFGGILLGATVLRRWLQGKPIAAPVIYAAATFVCAYLLYFPWYATFASQARGLGINLFNATPLVQFFVQFAPFAIAMPAFLLALARHQSMPLLQTTGRAVVLTLGAFALIILAALAIGLISPQLRGLLDEINATGSVLGVPRDAAFQSITARLTKFWEPLFLLLCVAFAALIARTVRRLQSARPHTHQPIPVFVSALFAMGAIVAVSVEFVFLLDNFGTRMNSMFKFWYMSWSLWSIGTAFAVMLFIRSRKAGLAVITTVILVFAAAGLLYPIYTALSRTNGFAGPATLDGAAYMLQYHQNDAKAIAWLNANVTGSPVVAEAPANNGGSYKYEGRISAFTGLPTPLGWGGHESQWRGNYVIPGRREPQIDSFFNTTDPSEFRRLATALNIDYVVIGETERARYTAAGLEKFSKLAKIVFTSGDTVIVKIR